MRRQSKTKSKFAVACLVVLSAEMIAALGAGWTFSRRQAAAPDPVVSPAEVVALRFPDELEATEAAQPAEASAVGEVAQSDANEVFALFDPTPFYQSRSAPVEALPRASVEVASLPQTAPVTAPIPASQAQLATAATKLASAAAHRTINTRPGAVLSDGQIANIKQRLKLTPDQQQMWPAVEVALRNLSYGKKTEGVRKNGTQDGGSRVAMLDTDSSEVQHLTSAAFPLVMSFSDDQKRELHVLAHVAGLEQLVPKF
jgi:hypothetical protein